MATVASSQVAGGGALWLKSMGCLLPPKQDITSLLHTIYEVVDSSVNHSPTSSKTLRVKLTVAPDGSQSKRSVLFNQTGESDTTVPNMGKMGRPQVRLGGKEEAQVPWTDAWQGFSRPLKELGPPSGEGQGGNPRWKAQCKQRHRVETGEDAGQALEGYESGEVSGTGS